jgi:hypothetical protein
MGALSSWAMLAFTHHYIVHYAAWSTCVVPIGERFLQYAVLGDDIVIWNKTVAEKYITVMHSLGVGLGLAKSIISQGGTGAEFAKRTLLGGVDVSPVPFKESSAAHRRIVELRQFCLKYQLSPMKAVRYLGYGYKVDPSKNTFAMNVFKLVNSIPLTYKALIDLFTDRDRPFIDFNKGQDYEKFKILINLINSETIRVHRELKDSYYALLQWYTALALDTYPLWSKDHLRARLQYETVSRKVDSMLKELESGVSMTRSSVKTLQAVVERVNSPIYPLLPEEEDILSFLSPTKGPYRGIAAALYQAQQILSSNQVSTVINPVMAESAPVSHWESKRTLRLWNRWAKTLLKANIPYRDANTLNKLNIKLNAKIPLSM